MLEFFPKGSGVTDVVLMKFDEHYAFTKASLKVKNIIFGGMYVDIGGKVEGINFKTGWRCEILFFERQSKEQNSQIKGTIWDQTGREMGVLTGSWLSEISLQK